MEKVRGYLNGLNAGEIEALENWCRVEIARSDHGAESFEEFYHLVWGRELPRHAKEEWLPILYQAKAQNKGVVIEAFRGSSKTTSLTITWLMYQIGIAPEKSNLLIQISDEAARDTSGQIASMIEINLGWRWVFPHVVPDKRAGWGTMGYEVKRVDMVYSAWRKLAAQAKAKDPTLVGLGYRSGSIIGKHPSGVLFLDDIHDEQNTRSARELALVEKIVTGTILPTITPETMQVVIGTPWVEKDVLSYLKSTGEYLSVKTPILREVEAKPTPVWPERFGLSEIEKHRQLAGEVEFARMYLLDLKSVNGVFLRRNWLNKFPMEKIDPSWPVVMGVDYASVADGLVAGKRDYFAVAIGRALPGGAGMVLVDGFRGQVSQGEAEEVLKSLVAIYPSTQIIGVEAVGKGEEFFHLMLRHSRLPIRAVQPGGRSKGMRFERAMAPLFEFGRVWISDLETPFIRSFEEEWVKWPQGEHDDCLDAVYWMLYVGLPHLLGGGDEKKKKRRGKNPFIGL